MTTAEPTTQNEKTKSLLVIDNAPIRQKAIYRAEKWIKKIEALEKSAEKYHELDFKLYNDWYNLTLNPLIEKVSEVEADYLKAAQIYNILVFIATEEDMTLPEAFLFLQEEEENYLKGDQAARDLIDRIRAKRAYDLENAIEKEYDGNEQPHDYTNIKEQVEAELEKIKARRERNKDKIAYYENLSDAEIFQIMSQDHLSYSFVMDAAKVLLESSRADILRRLWDCAPRKLKKQIDQDLQARFKKSFAEILHAEEEKALAFYAVLGDHDAIDSDSEEINFGDRKKTDEKPEAPEEYKFDKTFFNPKAKEASEDDRVRTKYLFRKIARKVHPDHLNPEDFENLKSWFDIIWKKVSVAHSRNDYRALEVLHHKIMVVLKAYDELTILDLEQAANAFEAEYRATSDQIDGIKNSPAWNFSKLKSYAKLERQQAKPFLVRLEDLNEKIESLENQKEQIALYANMLKQENRAPKRRSAKTYSSKGNQNRSRRSVDQYDLFE